MNERFEFGAKTAWEEERGDYSIRLETKLEREREGVKETLRIVVFIIWDCERPMHSLWIRRYADEYGVVEEINVKSSNLAELFEYATKRVAELNEKQDDDRD